MPDSRPPRAPRLGLPSRQAVRLAALLWVVLGIVLWNALFDHAIVVAGREYLFRQAQALRHNGPPVTIAEVMRPAAARGAVVASLWSLLVTSAGLAALSYARSRSGRRRETAGVHDLVGREPSTASRGDADPPGTGSTSTTFPS